MTRTIKLFATLRDFVGAREISVQAENNGTVRDLIGAIHAANPKLATKILDESGQLSGAVHIFVNGRNIEWLQGLDTPLSEADELFLIPPVAGG